jgi:hypothetical protein
MDNQLFTEFEEFRVITAELDWFRLAYTLSLALSLISQICTIIAQDNILIDINMSE